MQFLGKPDINAGSGVWTSTLFKGGGERLGNWSLHTGSQVKFWHQSMSYLVFLIPYNWKRLCPFIFAGRNLNEIPVMLLQMTRLRSDGIMQPLQAALHPSAGKLAWKIFNPSIIQTVLCERHSSFWQTQKTGKSLNIN